MRHDAAVLAPNSDALKKEEMESMFRNIMAVHLVVRDLAKCTEFYRDTLGLQVRENWSTPDSIAFQIDNVYFWVLEASGAARLVSEGPLDLKTEGDSRVLLSAVREGRRCRLRGAQG